MSKSNDELYKINTGILPKDAFIVIVHTIWNADIVNKMLASCISTLQEYEMNNIKVIQVPGAFEIPFSIKQFWGNYSNKFEKPQAFIALGCVLRGDTPHFDYVCKALTDGIVFLNLHLPAPTIFGVLTVDNQQQADDRTGGKYGNKGEEAALSALKMIEHKYSLRP